MQDLFQEGVQNTETPFTPVLLHTGETMIIVSKTNQIEKRFVTQLLAFGTREVSTRISRKSSKSKSMVLLYRSPNKHQHK